jgi:hypothetical protein
MAEESKAVTLLLRFRYPSKMLRVVSDEMKRPKQKLVTTMSPFHALVH